MSAVRLKRVLDVIGATVCLVVGSPVIAAVAILVWISMGRPILFRQERIGFCEKRFTIVKFRTMTSHRASDGHMLPDHLRLTAVGRFLRSTSLDELPELLNILKGDMSMVGPRPLLPEYLPRYSARQRRRHEVPPGLTGWCQVNGRNAPGWNEKLEMDVWYVDNRSLQLDLLIMLRTIKVVLSRRGVSKDGLSTEEPFTGGVH